MDKKSSLLPPLPLPFLFGSDQAQLDLVKLLEGRHLAC